jgi:hypothetical protein
MKRRICWLIPDLASARRAMHDLQQAGVDLAHMHFAGAEGTDMSGLHTANVWQSSDLIHAAKLGLVVGGVFGFAAGTLSTLLFPIAVEGPQWEVPGILAVLGGLIGAWSASMVGISIPSAWLRRYEGALEEGRILLMVDLPRERVQEIEALLRATHPELWFAGEERRQPAFP